MSMENLRSLKHKKYQRAMNKLVRNFNEAVKADWLWAGRFTMRQTFFVYQPYEDHSGMECYFILQLKDNKTGCIEEKSFDQYNVEYGIGRWANECITETWKIWDENPNPNEQARLEGRTPDYNF